MTGWRPPLVLALVLSFLETAHANVVGPDSQNFNPTTNGIDYVTVQSSTTLSPGIINLGAYINYAVNSLPVGEDDDQNRLKFNDTLLMSDLNVGVGLLRGWDVGFSYPRLLRQKIDSSGPQGQFTAVGNTELRVNTKFRLLNAGGGTGAAAVFTAGFNRILNNPYTGEDPGPSVTSELVFDRGMGPLKGAVNLGYRARNPGTPIPDSPIQPTHDQLIASVGTSYFSQTLDTKFIAEIFGSRAVSASETAAFNRQASSVELIGGIKHDVTSSLALHAGLGTELIHGASSPDWRAYAGVNWSLGPVFDSQTNVVLVETAEAERESHLSFKELKPGNSLGPVVMGTTTLRSYSITFKFDSVEVTDDSRPAIALLAEYLMVPPVFKVLTIEGHTDSVGAAAYNMALSIRRAETIRQILIKQHKIDPAKLKVQGYGEERPVADNGNYQGRQLNRRVDFIVNR